MIVAEIELKGKWVSIIDMRPTPSQREWLRDLRARWGKDVTRVEFKRAPEGWARRAHGKGTHDDTGKP